MTRWLVTVGTAVLLGLTPAHADQTLPDVELGTALLVVRVESDADLAAVQQRAWQGDYDGRDVVVVDASGATVWTWPEGEGK